MNTDINMNAEIPQNAVSVYRQPDSAMDDFPVLKAFQQYIDAEQSKARKRMVSLCIFFGMLMTIVIAVFMIMIHEVSKRNQHLNDRLVEYVMSERDRQPIVVQPPLQQAPQQPAGNEAMLQAMTDTLVALQKQISEQQHMPAPATVAAPQQTQAEIEFERKTLEAEEQLRKARALLDAEKRKLADEREKLRQEEIERHRRKLYPEYYGSSPEQTTPPKKAVEEKSSSARPQFTDDDIADILRDAAVDAKETDDDETDYDIEDAIDYFKDDEYQFPVEVKGTSTKWHVPLD
jgi:hypothetical protein